MKLNGTVVTKSVNPIKNTAVYGKVKQLLCELSNDNLDDNNNMPVPSSMYGDPQQPWLQEFCGYLNSKDQLASNMPIVQWWGLNATRYPVWSSLAHDYLLVIATSVSSEHMFLSAAITISK